MYSSPLTSHYTQLCQNALRAIMSLYQPGTSLYYFYRGSPYPKIHSHRMVVQKLQECQSCHNFKTFTSSLTTYPVHLTETSSKFNAGPPTMSTLCASVFSGLSSIQKYGEYISCITYKMKSQMFQNDARFYQLDIKNRVCITCTFINK